MKFSLKAIGQSLFLAAATVKADPVPANLKVFCFRITDIREDCEVPNRFFFEYEVLNWSDAYAGGVQVSLAFQSDRNLTFAEEFTFSGIDQDGRPLILEDTNGDGTVNSTDLEDNNSNGTLDAGEDKNGNERLDNDPAPGNRPTDNKWIRKSATDSTIIWEMGQNGSPVSYINLVDTNGLPGCIPNTMGRVVGTDGSITPTEAIDNGLNVKDGFVMTIDGFEPGMTAHINWFLLGAGGDTSPLQGNIPSSCRQSGNPHVTLGEVIPNPYGNGMVSIARIDGVPMPSPAYQLQTGYTQSTRDFFDSVYNVPNCPDPNIPGDQPNVRKDAEFAMEFSPTVVGGFCMNTDAPNGVIPNAGAVGQVNILCGGDPHFMTWNRKRFDYHGQCDLVLANLPNFKDGVGLDVHVRTRIESIYSIVTGTAIRVGNAIFEFDHETIGQPKFYVDGMEIPELPFEDELFKVSTYTIESAEFKQSVDIYTVDLGNDAAVTIEVMGMWSMVEIAALGPEVVGSTGLSGSYPGGQMLARDGVTDLSHDRNAYGSEWQVQEDEPKLFRTIPDGHPQAPQNTCKMPEKDAHTYFRENKKDMYVKAYRACKALKLTKADLKDCTFDVMVMENVDIARAWWGHSSLVSPA